MEIVKKFDDISQSIYEKTGKKYNIGFIAVIIFLLIFAFVFIKSFLGWLVTLL